MTERVDSKVIERIEQIKNKREEDIIKKKQEEEWKTHFLERSRLHNKKYRDKKRQELIEQGVEVKRGRPRKIKESETEK